MSSIKDIYQVRLPVFEGPLDLLLHLIEREKLDISTVSLAQITDQFLAYIRVMEELHPEVLADFLAMAARLVWIKSRLLLPQPPRTAEEPEEDPGEDLARRLREYKRFKEAARQLQEIAAGGRRAFVRVAPAPEFERQLRSCDISLEEFLAAVARAFAEARAPAAPVGTVVKPFTVSIHDQIQHIRRLTAGGRPVTFRSLLRHAQNRVEVIVTLLALLELLKRRRVTVEQTDLFGEINIVPVQGADDGEE